MASPAIGIMSLYDALVEGGASETKAREAAQDVANCERDMSDLRRRFERLDGRVSLLTWMVSVNTALALLIVGRLFTLPLENIVR